jgi:hypothetical protein
MVYFILSTSLTRYYSVETYFATRSNLRKLISKVSYTLPNDIPDFVMELAENNIGGNATSLYYISLEALKNACIKGYDSVVCYKDGEFKVTDANSTANLMCQINQKIPELGIFAISMGISIEDLKFIAKGKWYLFSYVYQLIPVIRDLKNKCNAGNIPQCRSCLVGNLDDCLYKLKKNSTDVNSLARDLNNDIMEFIDEESLRDVIGLFKGLNPEIV